MIRYYPMYDSYEDAAFVVRKDDNDESVSRYTKVDSIRIAEVVAKAMNQYIPD